MCAKERDSINENIMLWRRYIDNVLVLWKGDGSSFHSLVQKRNMNRIGLTFTSEYNEYVLPFLDVLIFKKYTLTIKVFRKKTTTNSLLKWESCHPRPLVRSIPSVQFLRLRRNCSELGTFKPQAEELNGIFMRRGYPQEVLYNAYSTRDRTSLLTPKPPQASSKRADLRIIGNFNQRSYKVRCILSKYWDILKTDAVLTYCLANPL